MARNKQVRKPRVVLEGQFFAWHSLAHVNRELARTLTQNTAFAFAIDALDGNNSEKGIPGVDDLQRILCKGNKRSLTIRHAFPPNLTPGENIVLMQPWEFIEAPFEWVEFVANCALELWVPSRFARESFIRSGLEPGKVRVIPLGYDGSVFYPTANKEDERKPFRFIYVGGTIERKGADILLNAYSTEFRQDENVELIIKDFGTKHVYRHNNLSRQILANLDKPGPKITYISDDLQPAELADLYRAANCLVQPYRAEGFCIPVLEAMACGLPVIVTAGGPTDEFVGQRMGWHISSRRAPIAQVPGLKTLGGQGWLEPSIEDLRQCMRGAFENPQRAIAFGIAASDYVKSCYTWQHVGPDYSERIETLLESRPVQKSRRKPTLSLCMIAKDEERIIADCLSTARQFVDEIVLVDTGSSDATKSVAEQFVDKLVDFEWIDDFSAARNESIKHASGDWILWLDADDTLPEDTGHAIRRAIDKAPPNMAAFVVPVRFPDGSPSGGTTVDHVKVIRNRPGISFEGRIHEQILPSLRRLGGEIARIDAVVMHTNYDQSVAGQTKKQKRDKRLLELDLKERPNHPFVLFNLGMTDHYNGDHEKAIEWLRRSISLAATSESHVRKAYALMVGSLAALGQTQEAINVASRALEIYPDDPELLFHGARFADEEGDPHRAIDLYKRILATNYKGHFSSFDHGVLDYKTHHNIAGIYARLRDYEPAREHWLKAISFAPEFTTSVTDLFHNALAVGDAETAKLAIEHVQTYKLGRELWRAMAGSWLLKFESSQARDEFLSEYE